MTELSSRRRYLILAICCLSLVIVSMDNTITNVALPDIQKDLGSTLSGLQWTIDAYTLVLASLLMLSGSTADRLGRRRTFQVGLTLFSIGSLLCSVAPSPGWLIVFRMLQAVGGSMLNPVAMSIITNVFTDPKERARAIGVWGAVVGIGLALGPIVGGLLTESVGWRAIFWINVPIGVAAVVLSALFVPESKADHARRLDPVGQLLVIVVLATATYAIIEAPRLGWTSPEVIGLFAAAVVALATLLWFEPRRPEPLIQLSFFRSIPFSAATVTAFGAFGAFSAFLFLNTLYLQEVRGLSALDAGLRTLPLAIMTSIMAPIAGRLVSTRGPRVPLVVAGVAIAGSAVMMTQLTAGTTTWYLLVAYVIFGFGFGLINPPITNAAVSGMPRSQAGVAAAVASTSRQVGSAFGVAISGSLAGAGATGALGPSFAIHTHSTWWISVGVGIVVVVLGLVATTVRARATARAVADGFDTEPAPAVQTVPA